MQGWICWGVSPPKWEHSLSMYARRDISRPRLIPCLLLKNGLIVRSNLFKTHQVIGNPMATIRRFSNWNVDELVLLDISDKDYHDLRRDDFPVSYRGTGILDVLREVAKVSFMPLAIGGRVRTLDDISLRLANGADKVVINAQAVHKPQFIVDGAERFGSQCIVVSIDALKKPDGSHEVYTDDGKTATGLDPAAWAKEVEKLGAGEIFLNSIDRDGTAHGYDLELVRSVTGAVKIPVIACGGVGSYADFPTGITAGASAVAAANIFHFFEISYPLAKKACIDTGLPMRAVGLDSKWLQREPKYDVAAEDARLATRLEQAKKGDFPAARPEAAVRRRVIRWCKKCVYPSLGAAPMEFDEDGICMGCRMSEAKRTIPPQEWEKRKAQLVKILEANKSKDGSRYDCVIAVSGGKDSYFQTHVIKNVLGYNPLLVTYDGNNWTPTGWHNLMRMSEAFGVDHIICRPSITTLKKLNRLGFTVMGDMNWHAHVGINTAPVRAAVQNKVPIVIWGEHGYMDLSGQFSMNDFPEMSYRQRLEHFGRGYEWTYMVGREGLTAGDMIPFQYPTDQEIYDLNLRGIYIGNYIYWEANDHTRAMIEMYDFKVNEEPFDRTYRRMSNLDDMHENGVHDYLKWIKFGYGRCTDHACKDIRSGQMGRGQAISLVQKYDPVKPRDIYRWLEYAGMSMEEFDSIADTFRDPRVWRWENGKWAKDSIT
jgi:imidazoleglycerol phosphate synthase cyclase subunit